MSLRSRSLRVIGSLLIVATFVAGSFADTLRLKDGSIIKGKIVSFKDGKFVVAMGEGPRRREMTFFANEIDSILFDTPQTNSAANRNASYTEPPVETPPAKVINSAPPKQQPSSSGGGMKPIEWTVKVLADNTANGWTNTGWVVKKGQHIHISGDGKVSLGTGRSAEPSGNPSLNDEQKLLKNVPTGALIAVIGDDNNDFIYVGAEREITATRDGALFLGINEGNLDDNSGAFNVKIEILPDAPAGN